MDKTTGLLARLEYPGRLIAMGLASAGARAVVVYAITGRSPSSQARKLVHRDSGIWVQPTDEDVLKKGNVDLLVYPALLFGQAGVAVSNGKQTAAILDALVEGDAPVAILSKVLAAWDYEPDAPIFTPRISGCLVRGAAGLSIVHRGESGETLRSYFEVPLREGEGRLVSTYEGPNREPLPCFEGEPRRMALAGTTPRETAEDVYRALAPAAPDKDFRVAVACVLSSLSHPNDPEVHIINRYERT
jgi:IMP cyclohydrolase